MESSTNTRRKSSQISERPPKRLVFDRRYGWVFDEWKDPAEEALAGGRGMFCILPLAKAFLKTASQSINLAASSAVKVFEKPDLLSPQVLHASLNDQLHKIMSSIRKPEVNMFVGEENSSSHASTSFPAQPHLESGESQVP
ncbi:uncharacterized protein LOC120006804 [Tripterygium wilfordii]|uniref:uncharacterized protein LOC120006804 n=1 Tax=Tripterygium wilfordii TaxID=458696 RepID=UPI0018F841BC|nr:uncharacterized protein LOC120006804 [Tripterygium wilfordii]